MKKSMDDLFPLLADEQKAYLIANEIYMSAREVYMDSVREFILKSGFRNKDGSVPEYFYKMDDTKEILRLVDEYERLPEKISSEQYYQAEQILRKAEDELIDWMLDQAPEESRDKINSKRYVLNIRTKLLDLALQLNNKVVVKKSA